MLDRSHLSRLFEAKHAWRELLEIVANSRVWRSLARADIRSRYRRAVLGPFWITLTTGSMALAIGVIYGQFLGQSVGDYLPYLTTGLIIWAFIAAQITEGCNAFIGAGPLIRSSSLPIAFHVMRTLQRNFIVFLHNALIIVLAWIFLRWNLDWYAFLALPGLALLYVFLASVSTIIAIICVRFRDVPPMMQAGTQFLFFASPVIWYPESLRFGTMILYVNPTTYMLAITRDPLLGRFVSLQNWLISFGLTLITLILAVLLYVRYRDRVAYWV